MLTGFLATQFSVVHENGVLITSLAAPSSDDEDFYLMLQYQDEYEEEDIQLGMAQPYIEYCGQAWSWYGHILSFTLHRNSVVVKLDDEAALRMQNDGELEVRFNLTHAQFNTLRSALQQTFAGYTYYRDAA